jgi:acetyl esterase/lipase
MLATDHEGRDVARWLNSLGITAGIPRYRLGPKYHHPAPLQDAQRAIRMMRANASNWSIHPDRIGILGFSAGGHLASTALTHFSAGQKDATDPLERESSRPDFGILVYPVISLGTAFGHGGSRRNLLGEEPDAILLQSLTNETQVTKDTPPVFLVHTAEDTAVPPENSMLFASALRKAGIPFELHIFEQGAHGLGLGTGAVDFKIAPDSAFQAWPALCGNWLRVRGLLPTAAK